MSGGDHGGTRGPTGGRLTVVGFDADDTLWHNEKHFKFTEARFAELLAEHGDPVALGRRLVAAEKRNLALYGFGVKGFALSMIETAIEVTDGRVSARVIKEILDTAREMLRHPVEPLPHARETLAALHGAHRLVLVTKGDLFDQERKLAESGLGDFFSGVEIVSDKTPDVYARVFARHGTGAAEAMMVGNSVKSDILPALAAGAHAVHVPHELMWELEHADLPEGAARFHRAEHLGEVPDIVAAIG